MSPAVGFVTSLTRGVLSGRPGLVLRRLSHSHGTALVLFFLLFLLGDGLSRDWVILLTWPMTYAAMAVIFLSTGAHRFLRVANVVIAAVTYPLGVASVVSGVEGLADPGSEIFVLYAVTALVLILRDVLRREQVTLDTVFGALTGYLLLGIVFALVYHVVANIDAEAFVPAQHPGDDSQLFYFSFVTLTTLGYGDIQPASDWVRSLAVIEGLTGQMFLVVLVARLVGLEIAQRAR